MHCLTCDQDLPQQSPQCSGCGAFLGDPSEGWGFLPQLKSLEDGLQDGSIEAEEADVRLNRAEEALHSMLVRMEQTAENLPMAGLEEVQQSMLASILGPLGTAITDLMGLVHELPVDEAWGPETWAMLSEAQKRVFLGSRGLDLSVRMFAQATMGSGVDQETLAQVPDPHRKG